MVHVDLGMILCVPTMHIDYINLSLEQGPVSITHLPLLLVGSHEFEEGIY